MLDKIQLSFQAVDNCFVGVEGTLHKLFQTPAKFVILIFNSIFIFNLSPIVFVVLCTSVLVSHFLYRKISKYSFSKAHELSRLDRKTNYYYNTTSDFSFGKDIRIFQIQDLLRQKFKQSIEEKVAVNREIQNYTLFIKTFCNIASVLGEGVAYIYLVFSYVNGSMSVGDFFLYFGLITIFSSSLVDIVTDIAFVNSESLKVRYFRIFLSFEDDGDKSNLKSIEKSSEYSIDFRNVSFKYPKSDNWVCRNLSFTIESGQSIAIVGYNGAGKSTIIKLLMRLYDPIEGAIFINGINIKEFDRKEYYKLFSVIFQDIKIFAASVEQNIAMSLGESVSKEKVKNSAKIANIDQKISSLQNGYNTNLLKVIDEDGTELSGGQNQRIALARAIYKDGPFFILDEPTSAMDPMAEYQFYMNFRNIVRGKTAIYISHRLASTKFCDKIFCFEKGCLIEEGTHEELLQLNGTYAKLYRIQSEKFQSV
ncbi:ABC transporter ATP-binding protein [Paenibacillus motobuensis]|uniref:ABC transporter ATP-binding protein n=1 Tax=Paenibacillus motobuensis TaxID=295324 RepID=UPI0031E150B6